jgi:hypothetical protein
MMAWIEGSRLASRSLSRSAALRDSVRSGLFLARPVEEMIRAEGIALLGIWRIIGKER